MRLHQVQHLGPSGGRTHPDEVPLDMRGERRAQGGPAQEGAPDVSVSQDADEMAAVVDDERDLDHPLVERRHGVAQVFGQVNGAPLEATFVSHKAPRGFAPGCQGPWRRRERRPRRRPPCPRSHLDRSGCDRGRGSRGQENCSRPPGHLRPARRPATRLTAAPTRRHAR